MKTNIIYNKDCIEGMKELPDESIDLSFSDIPFNIDLPKKVKSRRQGFDGISYKDDLSDKQYAELIGNWIEQNYRILKPHGTLVIMSGWSNLRIVLNCVNKSNFCLLNHCIVKYAFGIYTKKRFVTSHYHVLFLTKSNKVWTFNKQKKYDEDVWLMNRDLSAKKIGHPCPTTQEWIKKIVLTSSNKGDVVLDSFMGSGNTAIVCLENNRQFIGYEINPQYYKLSLERLSDKTSTLPNGNSDKSEEFNMGLKVQKSKISSPKLSPMEITSPNPNIMFNSDKALVGVEKQDGC